MLLAGVNAIKAFKSVQEKHYINGLRVKKAWNVSPYNWQLVSVPLTAFKINVSTHFVSLAIFEQQGTCNKLV